MSDKTKIEWTATVNDDGGITAGATWNFLIGCTKKSAGCMHCYAIRQAWRLMHNPNPKIAAKFAGTVALDSKGELNWTGRINFDDETLLKPLSWRLPRRIFVNSLSDLFHKNVKDEWIDKAFAVMALCPQHVFQILTKEPERMRDYIHRRFVNNQTHLSDAACWASETANALAYAVTKKTDQESNDAVYERLWGALHHDGYFPNVWLGTSCEDQKTADERVPLLLQTPAAVRWISAEPLLGPVSLVHDDPYPWVVNYFHGTRAMPDCDDPKWDNRGGLDWVVAGGESGPGARPMHPDWVRSLRNQCVANGVPFFFKQWGNWITPHADLMAIGGVGFNRPERYSAEHQWSLSPRCEEPVAYNISKKAAGRLLDGREWNEFPTVAPRPAVALPVWSASPLRALP